VAEGKGRRKRRKEKSKKEEKLWRRDRLTFMRTSAKTGRGSRPPVAGHKFLLKIDNRYQGFRKIVKTLLPPDVIF